MSASPPIVETWTVGGNVRLEDRATLEGIEISIHPPQQDLTRSEQDLTRSGETSACRSRFPRAGLGPTGALSQPELLHPHLEPLLRDLELLGHRLGTATAALTGGLDLFPVEIRRLADLRAGVDQHVERAAGDAEGAGVLPIRLSGWAASLLVAGGGPWSRA